MESYIVSARKYRPDTFESVVAQKSLTTTLKNAIHSGKLAHAYLFCGPRGVGKTTCARIFAKTINCLTPTSEGEPCNKCESCLSFNQQRSYSIYELDAASNNSVEDIRSLNEQVRIPPQVGKYKVYIIDEVHMLSQAAFNAFLKTLEEPPAHAIFILATTEKHKIIPTILSRCQIYDFSRIEAGDIIGHLQNIAAKEGINTEFEALRIIAQKSDGCMRDALSLFDQMASFTQGDLTYTKVIESLNVLDYEYYFRLTDFILDKNISQSLLLFNEVLNRGFEGNIFIEGMASHLRDLLINSDPATVPLFEGSEELKSRYTEQAKRCTAKTIFKAIKICNNCGMNYRTSRNKRLLVELALIEMSQIGDGDGDGDGGRSPKMLKPIFQQLQQTAVATQPANGQQVTPTQPTATKANVSEMTRPVQPAQPVQPTVVQGRPAELQAQRANGPARGMFSRSHSTIANTVKEQPKPVEQQPATRTAAAPEKPAPAPAPAKSLTNETLSQAWRTFALQLPENERALADRMKIMTPTLIDESNYEISVDNQLVAELFEKEEKRIAAGISKYTNGLRPKMNIRINKVIVERHVNDRNKQFSLLKEKNPLIEKLRKELNLEFAR